MGTKSRTKWLRRAWRYWNVVVGQGKINTPPPRIYFNKPAWSRAYYNVFGQYRGNEKHESKKILR